MTDNSPSVKPGDPAPEGWGDRPLSVTEAADLNRRAAPPEVIECCGRPIVFAALGLSLVCLRMKDHEGECVYGLRILR